MNRFRIPLFLVTLVVSGVFLLDQCKPKSEPNQQVSAQANTYVGNASCQSCHASEHQQWQTSHHFHAMEPANDSTVRGDFNNQVFKADGVVSTFFKKEGKFFINTQGPDGLNHDYEVKYTFGYEPLQQYLIEFPGGRMQATRASWDTKKKVWFHQYPGQKFAANDWLHWTGNGQNWNTMCASCHSTQVEKKYNIESDSYQTHFNEVNVSCEACHGPGKAHLDYVGSAGFKNGSKEKGSKLWLTKSSSQQELVNACGNCHGRRVDLTGATHAGAEYLQDFIPELPTNTFFFADGQMDEEDFNYTSFLQSKMFHRGVQCTNCHNPHSGNLLFDGSKTCNQCHAPATYNVSKHTMHPDAVSTTVNCISCHMPAKMYMGNDLRHDHSFRIPRPDQSVQYGTPNTCNSCHSNQSAAWAAVAIAKHYGPTRKPHYSDDLLPGSRLNDQSEVHLKKLLQDTATPQIVRAAAVDYWSRLLTIQSAPALVELTNDPNPMVRHAALKGLRALPANSWIQQAGTHLADPVRAVRLAAADLYAGLPPDQMPGSFSAPFQQANGELQQFLLYQTDFAQGNLQAGDYYRRVQRPQDAIRFYQYAIKKDSLLTLARVNLASVLNEQGRNPEALAQLTLAAKLEPKSDHVQYNLGLLQAEMGDSKGALNSLRRAVALKSQNTRVYYNYGILLQQQGMTENAANIYEQGLKMMPTEGDLLYAAAILYLQSGKKSKANEKIALLKQHHGNNPQYQNLLQNFR